MKYDSAVELQGVIFRDIFKFVPLPGADATDPGEALYVHPRTAAATGFNEFASASSQPVAGTKAKGPASALTNKVALGVSASTGAKKENKLAVLVQSESAASSALVDDIKAKAKQEVDVIYVGAQKTFWTQNLHNPIVLGCSVSPTTVGYAGTLGCFCKDNATGKICILSNNHVLANVNSLPVKTPIMQQGALDGGRPTHDVIGHLHRFVQIQFGGVPNHVDAAIALLKHKRKEDRTSLFSIGGPPTVAGSFVAGPGVQALPGMDVQKVGRTTQHTVGRVRAVNVNNYVVNMGKGIGLARFDGQIIINSSPGSTTAFSSSGDSGSMIVDSAGNPVGLLFAGSNTGGNGNLGVTAANPISTVTTQLGVTLI